MSSSTASGKSAYNPANRRRSRIRPLHVALVGAVVLIVAMATNTRWLDPKQVYDLTPHPYNPIQWAADNFPTIKDLVIQKAVPLSDVQKAVDSNLETAGKTLGIDSGGKYTIPVKFSGTVENVDDNFIYLKVDGVAYKVVVPIGLALSGNPLRDYGGYKFGDFPDQTGYQYAADELKNIVRRDIIDKLDKATLAGKSAEIVGCWSTIGAPKTFLIQPVQFEVK